MSEISFTLRAYEMVSHTKISAQFQNMKLKLSDQGPQHKQIHNCMRCIKEHVLGKYSSSPRFDAEGYLQHIILYRLRMKTPHCYKQQIINNKPKNQILPECNIFYVVGLELWEICTPAVMYGAWMYRNFFLIHRIIKVVACHMSYPVRR
jgi:hypothetical protein